MAYQLNMFGDTTKDERSRVVINTKRGGRIVSLGETQRVYRTWGTGLVKCLHGRSYFVECVVCKRTRSEAEDNFANFSERIKAQAKL